MAYKMFKMVDGELCLDRDEVLLYSELNAVWKLDKGSKGDNDGRKHLLANKYFKFIYLVCDPHAYPSKNGMNELEAVNHALKHTEIDREIMKEAVMLKAMKFYIDHVVTQAQETAYESRRAMRNTTKAMAKVNTMVEKTIEKETDITKTEMEDLFGFQERMSKLVVDLPSRFKLIDELEKLAEDIVPVEIEKRGGGVVEDSMDPKNAY